MQYQHETLLGDWRRYSRDRLLTQPQSALLPPLLPARSWMVDLFTLYGPTGSLEHGLDHLRHRSRATLRCEIDDTARRRRLPSWAGRLADGEPEWLDHLDSAIRATHQAAVAPYWSRVKAHLRAEHSTLGRLMLSSGVEQMLAALHPRARWDSSVLHLPAAYDQEIHLQGRGLLIAYSVYCWPFAVPVYDGDDDGVPPRLFVPAARDLLTLNQITALSPPDEGTLGALIGHTRAALLYAMADGHATTSDLARRVGVSLASMSQHTAVLRGAGLISTRRTGMAVHHALTPLGHHVLEEQTR